MNHLEDGTYNGQFEDLFEIDNLFDDWRDDRHSEWYMSLYYDCRAIKTMAFACGYKIDAGDVIDLVLYCSECRGEDSCYFAFSECDEEMREKIRLIKRIIQRGPNNGGNKFVKDTVVALTACYNAKSFSFNDAFDDESS